MGLIWLVALAFIGYGVWKVFLDTDVQRRKAALQKTLEYAATIALAWFAFRSGLPWLMLLILVLFALTRGGPAVARHYRQKGGAGHSARPRPRRSEMSRDQAFSILGLSEGASDTEINERYRQLMRKVHPDQGGSGYLATQLNEAKRTLLD